MAGNQAAIETIETEYKGLRFRSRTEARWAVFFDGAGIAWEYEPEGFKMEGVCYVPDFWLPQMGSYFEVKGQQPTVPEIYKALLLADHTGRFVMVAAGSPRREESILRVPDIHRTNGRFWFASDRRDRGVFWLVNNSEGFIVTANAGTDHAKEPLDGFGPAADGYKLAKTHRFDWHSLGAHL